MTKTAKNLVTYAAAGMLIMVAFATQPIAADTFMWVDSNGVVNYSERMPRDIDPSRVTRVKDSASGPSSTPSELAPAISTSAEDEPLNDSQQQMLADLQATEANRQQQVAQIRKDNCQRARRVLNNLQTSGRLRVRGEDGENRVMDEAERSQKISEAQRGIATNCDS